MDLQQKALTVLAQTIDRIDASIVDKWRHSAEQRDRENCATELRVLQEIKAVIEADLAHELRETDK